MFGDLKTRFNPPSRSATEDEKMWLNSPVLAPEERVQGLPWGLIPFIHITGRYIFLIFLLFTFASCYNNPDKGITNSRPGKNEMEDLNRYLVQKDRERIQNYIERKNLKMTESPTGLWYQILKEGEGINFTERDKVILDYECSLLDGTKCYSSKTLGPKEVILGRSKMEPGLDEGLRMMSPGAEAIFIIPPFLAYGFIGDGRKIPSRAVIVYNIYNLQAK